MTIVEGVGGNAEKSRNEIFDGRKRKFDDLFWLRGENSSKSRLRRFRWKFLEKMWLEQSLKV